jgi:hypothetical protein
MHLDLSDDETAALTKELDDIRRNDRYPLSERIRTIKAILSRLTPPPVPGASAAAEDGCAAESGHRQKTPTGLAPS